jgi:solute:Na+ symporter, SSS family
LPLYQLVLLFVFLVGFAAILQVPGLKGPDVDLALFRLSVKTFDPWLVGIIGAAGVLTALVPGSMILMTAATLLANNLYRNVRRSAADAHIARVARSLVPLVALVAVYFTLAGGETIVALLLMGYSFVTQLFPALILSLTTTRWVTPVGAAAGIVTGVGTVAAISLTHSTIATLFPALPSAIRELNVGLIALAANVIVLTVVTVGMKLATASSPAPDQADSAAR